MTISTMQQVSVGLSREEAYVAMRLCKLDELPGVTFEWITRDEQGEITAACRLVLDAALQGLMARGLLVRVQNADGLAAITLHPMVAGLVAGCALARETIVCSTATAGIQRVDYLHWQGDFGVIHSSPLAGIHLFEEIETHANVIEAALELFHLDAQQPLPGVMEERMQVGTLEQANELAQQGNAAGVIAALQQGGLTPRTAQAMGVAMCAQDGTRGSLLMTHKIEAAEFVRFMAVVATPTLCFRITAHELMPEQLSVASVAVADLREWLTRPPSPAA